MPEIKNHFAGGKMNKDVDERLVPKGEYRDAMNIQVSTSEDSEVGTIQNILGNSHGCTDHGLIPQNSFTVGSIADEKNDTLYWFISGNDFDVTEAYEKLDFSSGEVSMADFIWRERPDGNTSIRTCEPVFVDRYAFSVDGGFDFDSDVITGLTQSVISELEPGWTVTGVNSDGSTSDTSTVESINEKITSFGVSYSYSMTTVASTQLKFIGNYSAQGKIGSGVLIPMVAPLVLATQGASPTPTSPNDYSQAPSNIVYIEGFTWNTNALIGEEFTIFPDNNAIKETFTILQASNTQLTTPHGSGSSQGLSVVKLVLDNALSVLSNPALDPPTAGQAAANQPYTSTYQGQVINASVSYSVNTGVNIADGKLTIIDPLFDVSTISIGDQVVFANQSCTIKTINTVTHNKFIGATTSTTTTQITLQDSNGDLIQGWQVGGNIFGVPQPTTGLVILPGDIEVNLNSVLDLSDDYDQLFFSGPRVLNYNHNEYITGINIVDDMLFWTDGKTEPKKINIQNSVNGTYSNNRRTRLLNPAQDIDLFSRIPVNEEHITVIKKAPKNVLTVQTQGSEDTAFGDTNEISFAVNPANVSQGQLLPDMTFNLIIHLDKDTPAGQTISIGNVLLFNYASSNTKPEDDFVVSGEVIDIFNYGYTPLSSYPDGSFRGVTIRIKNISNDIDLTAQVFNWVVEPKRDKIFSNVFPRYSYRYKYIDGEYSTYAPFTKIIFQPDNFIYDVKDAYNKGMENHITKISLYDYTLNMPKDVVEIDLLYKESNSPIVYKIDTLYKEDILNATNYEVTTHQINSIIPENQLLRAYDNVPRKALAQELSGSRIIYGNYLQNYDSDNKAKIEVSLTSRDAYSTFNNENNLYSPSIKSLRDYVVGVSYLDSYGRQSPVFTNKDATISLDITKSPGINQLSTTVSSAKPDWAEYYKVYIKETSSEYFNLAMDRLYDAEDGNIWLSFPSSERNKVDEETHLILKKGVEGADPIAEDNSYKILAIKNEAPSFIKTKLLNIGETVGLASSVVFNSGGYPLENKKNIYLNDTAWDAYATPLIDIKEPLLVRFLLTKPSTGLEQATKIYEVSNFYHDNTSGYYNIELNKPISEEFLNDTSTPSQPDDDLRMIVYKEVDKDLAQFEGRFFVKVARDILIDEYIISQAVTSGLLTQVHLQSLNFYYLADQNGPTGDNTTSSIASGSGTVGGSTNNLSDWEAVLKPNGAARESFWFIDGLRYENKYIPNITYPSGATNYAPGLMGGPWAITSSAGLVAPLSPVPISTSSSVYGPDFITPGYNKGISEENGKFYIYLSYGNLENADSSGSLFPSQSANPNFTSDVKSYWDTAQDDQTIADYLNAFYYSGLDLGYFQGSNSTVNFDFGGVKHWSLGSQSLNPNHAGEDIIQRFNTNSKFIFSGSDTIYTIVNSPEITYHLNYTGWDQVYGQTSTYSDAINEQVTTTNVSSIINHWEDYQDAAHLMGHPRNRRVTYKIQIDKDPRQDPAFNPINTTNGANATTPVSMIFVEEDWEIYSDQIVAQDPAVWETEPKINKDLNIYYESDSTYPVEINNKTNYIFAPIGSKVHVERNGEMVRNLDFFFGSEVSVVGWNDNVVKFNKSGSVINFQPLDKLVFSRPDGSRVRANILELAGDINTPTTGFWSGIPLSDQFRVERYVHGNKIDLNWYNCYSFKNGVESNRIRDDFNQVTIDKGAKASSTLEETYKEERRKHGLIYSGLYNSNSGVNNLNQFIQAEKITKDINPTYGSIQKLYAGWGQGGDLLALCEDRILKIQANKDALFNADGDSNVTATNKVLGTTIPYSGEYGISKNPESFAAEAYRAYFTDKVRGRVMRLSLDGLTPISDHGMKSWFRDNLKISDTLIGSYDDKKDEYNITLKSTSALNTQTINKTVSFKESVRGWVSFKSFTPENAISCANEYYTFLNGKLWKHHDESADRNTFYGSHSSGDYSTFTAILNDIPGSVKSFATLNYEGSDSRIIQERDPRDNQYYNLNSRDGWYVDSIFTDKEKGAVDEFIEKEGKWFNYIQGKEITLTPGNAPIREMHNWDQASFAIQGLGINTTGTITTSVSGCTNSSATNWNPLATVDDGSCILPPTIYGCTDDQANNYNPNATVNQVSATDTNDPCTYTIPVLGCTMNTAGNYNSTANTDDGTCLWTGCTDNSQFVHTNNQTYPSVINYVGFPSQATTPPYNGSTIVDDGSCITTVLGCTDNTQFNFSNSANTDDGSCIPFVYGCMLQSADNYGSSVNSDNGTCVWNGCTEPLATNYFNSTHVGQLPPESIGYTAQGGYGVIDDGSCLGGGCTDATASNYNLAATYDDGSCVFCDWSASSPSAGSGYNGVAASLIAQDATNAAIKNGQLAIEVNLAAPYLHLGANNIFRRYEIYDSNDTLIHMTSKTATFNTQSGGLSSSMQKGFAATPLYNKTLNSVTTNNSVLFAGVPASGYPTGSNPAISGTYYAKVYGWYGMGEICEFVTNSVTVGVSVPAVLGCTDPTACNYVSAATQDNGTCEFVTCAGCMDPAANGDIDNNTGLSIPITAPYGAYNYQTNSNTNCSYQPQSGGGVATGCTIACGDGTDATSQGNGCCHYTAYGCTDPTATNYYCNTNTCDSTHHVIDDGSCVYPVYGCTDPAATNYNSLATVNQVSATNTSNPCNYPATISGCMDPAALNYNSSATNGTSPALWNNTYPCIYSMSQVTIGNTNSSYGHVGPAFYNIVGGQNFVAGMTARDASQTSAAEALNVQKKVQHMVIGNKWPLTSLAQADFGLSFKWDGPVVGTYINATLGSYQWGAASALGASVGGTIKIKLQVADDPTASTLTWNTISSYTNFSFPGSNLANTQPPGKIGNRVYSGPGGQTTGNLPFAWGPQQNASNNTEFDVYYNATTKNKYKLSVTQMINGIEYGTASNYSAAGHIEVFEISDLPCNAANPNLVNFGCTDPTACNYDMYHTCNDGSCYYQTVPSWVSFNPGSSNCVQCDSGGCAASGLPSCPTYNPNGTLAQIFNSQSACNSATGSS